MCLQYDIEITNTNMSFAIKTYIIDKAGRKTKAGRKKVEGGKGGSEYYCLYISHAIC